jgi:HK97 gp10 family phage protein
MSAVKVVITGIKDIDKRLRQLEPKVGRKVVRQAIRASLKIMAQEVKNQVPVRTGLTKSSVQVRALKAKKRGAIALEVRISGKVEGLIKTTRKGKRFFTPALVEYGHKGVAPNPFMRRAFEARGEQVRAFAIKAIRDGIEREIKSA